jgi:hypothetical protein
MEVTLEMILEGHGRDLFENLFRYLPDQPVDNTIGKDKKSIINVGSKT